MSVIATIEAKDVVQKILDHLGLPTDVPEPRPDRPPPGMPSLFPDDPADHGAQAGMRPSRPSSAG
jgi:hypothetical protein